MNKCKGYSKMWFMALLLVAFVAGCGSGDTGAAGATGATGDTGDSAPVATAVAVNLASAESYALTTSSGLTTSNASIVGAAGGTTFGGNVAMDAPTSTCTATPANATIQTGGTAVDTCGMEITAVDFVNAAITPTDPAGLTITGTTIRYALTNGDPFDATVRAVKGDVNAAWLDAFNQTGGTAITGPGALGGKTLTPGLYKSGSTMTLGSGETLTLDAQGNANAVWIFQVGSALTITGSTVACAGTVPEVCTPTQVVLANGALAKNVFWQVGTPTLEPGSVDNGDVTFPAATGPVENNTSFKGTILAGRSVTFAGGTAVEGRVLAGANLLNTPNNFAGAVSTTAGSTGPVIVTLPQ